MNHRKKPRILSYISLISVIASILLIFFTVNYKVTNTMFHKACETNLAVFKQSRAALSAMVEDVQFLSMSVLGNEQLIQYLRDGAANSSDRAMEQYKMRFTFSSLFDSRDYLDSVCIYNDDAILLQFGTLVARESTRYNSEIRARQGRVLWTAAESHPEPIIPNNAAPVVSLYRAINDLYAMKQLAYLRISIREDAISACGSDFTNDGNSTLLLVNELGQVVSASDKAQLGTTLNNDGLMSAVTTWSEGYTLQNGMVYSFYHVPSTDWYAIQQTPIVYLQSDGSAMRLMLALCMVLCIAIVLVFFTLQRRTVRTEEAYRSKLLNREMELKYLQGQINPHFLYNTLDTIRWMAIRAKQEDIARQIKALSDIFRHTLNRGQEFTSVRAEVDHVRKYLFIQETRFSDTLEHTIEIDARCLDATVPHLILQPLVENAVVHGLDGISEKGQISIRVYHEGDALYYEVCDNGVGFSTGEVKRKMQDPKAKHEVFALKNIDERIKLIYGDGYGLQMESHPGQGSRITVKLHLDCGRGEDLP